MEYSKAIPIYKCIFGIHHDLDSDMTDKEISDSDQFNNWYNDHFCKWIHDQVQTHFQIDLEGDDLVIALSMFGL